MDPEAIDSRIKEAWAAVRSFFDRRSGGSATIEDDPQPELAQELFAAWLRDREDPHMRRAMATAFAIWGNTDRAEEVEHATTHLDPAASYWNPAIEAIKRTYARAGRNSEGLLALHKLEAALTHPRSISALAECLAMEYLYGRNPTLAAHYFSQVVELETEGERAERARAYLYEIEHLGPGAAAPQIEGATLNGTSWSLSDQLGKVVCIEFWSTDCGFCWPEMPFLRKVRASFNHHDFALIGISKDQHEPPLREAIQQEGLNWPHIWEPGVWHGKQYEAGPAVKAYNAQGVPRSVVIDRNGCIVAMDLRGEDLFAAIRETIEAGRSPA